MLLNLNYVEVGKWEIEGKILKKEIEITFTHKNEGISYIFI